MGYRLVDRKTNGIVINRDVSIIGYSKVSNSIKAIDNIIISNAGIDSGIWIAPENTTDETL